MYSNFIIHSKLFWIAVGPFVLKLHNGLGKIGTRDNIWSQLGLGDIYSHRLSVQKREQDHIMWKTWEEDTIRDIPSRIFCTAPCRALFACVAPNKSHTWNNLGGREPWWFHSPTRPQNIFLLLLLTHFLKPNQTGMWIDYLKICLVFLSNGRGHNLR